MNEQQWYEAMTSTRDALAELINHLEADDDSGSARLLSVELPPEVWNRVIGCLAEADEILERF